MDCFGTYFTHVQTCDNVRVQSAIGNDNVRVQSATQWTASVHTLHMSKPVITFVFKVLRNGLLPYILYTCHMSKPVITFVFKALYLMDCFGTYFTHVQICDNVRVQRATQWTASQSATQWTPSVHTLHMSKPVITFVFKVLRNGVVHTLHMSKPVITFVFKVLRNGLLRHILYT